MELPGSPGDAGPGGEWCSLSVKSSSRTPAAPLPRPLLHILQGGLCTEQSLTPAFPDVPGTRAGLGPQGKAPSTWEQKLPPAPGSKVRIVISAISAFIILVGALVLHMC